MGSRILYIDSNLCDVNYVEHTRAKACPEISKSYLNGLSIDRLKYLEESFNKSTNSREWKIGVANRSVFADV